MLLATGVFACALALIATERVDRTKVALIGAAAVVLVGSIDQHAALEAIEFETLGLLVGMMIAVRLTETTGVFTFVAIRAAQIARGRPLALVALLSLATALLSGFLDNLTTILLVVPVTFRIARELEIDPVPLVIIEVIASNIGGTATLIGDPPNIMIAGHTGLSFMGFIVNLAPIAWLSLVVVVAGLYLWFRRSLRIPEHARDHVDRLDAGAAITDADELRRIGPLLLATIAVFFVHRPLGLEPATVALVGASAMLAATRQRVDRTLGAIDWATLFFFVGLFVIVGALEATGAISRLADALVDATAGNRTAELLSIAWGAAIVGGIVDNIPLTATMIPVVEEIAPGTDDDAHWWALALGACFGGNLTIVSAAANVAAAGLATQERQPIGFVRFLRIGVPVTVGSMVLATGYIVLRYA